MRLLCQILCTGAWSALAARVMLFKMFMLRGYLAIGGEAFLLIAFIIFCWQLTGCLWEKVNELL